MKYLAIDTSTEIATVTLGFDNEFYVETKQGVTQHAAEVLKMVDRLLSQAECCLADLDGLVLGCGPGSFTGVRVACSVAKGLAYANDLPVFPVTSLMAIAYEVSVMQQPESNIILTMLDARMGEVYWQSFYGALQPCPQGNDIVVTAPSAINVPGDAAIIIAGVGIEECIEKLPAEVQQRLSTKMTVYPNASSMIKYIQLGYRQPISAENVMPYYVRNNVVQS